MVWTQRIPEIRDGVEYWPCSKCKGLGVEYMKPREQFREDKRFGKPDSYCIPCRREAVRNSRANSGVVTSARKPREREVIDGVLYLSCCICRKNGLDDYMHPVGDFGIKANGLYRSYCRRCDRNFSRMAWEERRARDKERMLLSDLSGSTKPDTLGDGAPRSMSEEELDEFSVKFHAANGVPYNEYRPVTYDRQRRRVLVWDHLMSSYDVAAVWNGASWEISRFCGNGFKPAVNKTVLIGDTRDYESAVRNDDVSFGAEVRGAYRRFCEKRGIYVGKRNFAITYARY